MQKLEVDEYDPLTQASDESESTGAPRVHKLDEVAEYDPLTQATDESESTGASRVHTTHKPCRCSSTV